MREAEKEKKDEEAAPAPAAAVVAVAAGRIATEINRPQLAYDMYN